MAKKEEREEGGCMIGGRRCGIRDKREGRSEKGIGRLWLEIKKN